MAAEKPEIIEDKEETPKEKPIPEKAPLVLTHYIRFNSGDTLESISKEWGTSPEDIIEFNKINPAALQVGHWLYV